MIRRGLAIFVIAASSALVAAALGPAGPAGATPAAPGGQAQAAPPLARPGAIEAGLNISMTPARAVSAARRCASWASKVGFAHHGRGGRLVTAVAIGLAESGCNAAACYNDTTGRECSPSSAHRRGDSIDRGAWQISSRYWKNVSDWCAYRGLCNARSAYVLVSAKGTYFRPWTTYLTGAYRRYLPAARAAVRALHGRQPGAGTCLTDPAGSVRPGRALRVGPCRRRKDADGNEP